MYQKIERILKTKFNIFLDNEIYKLKYFLKFYILNHMVVIKND